ncbi:hypothetical protein Tco_0472491 [Tanacetum coccineum]
MSGNPTPSTEPIISTSSLTLTPFGDSDFLLEETDAFLAIKDEPISPEIDNSYYDLEGDILLLEKIINDSLITHLSPHKNIRLTTEPHLEYAFLEGTDKLPVIIAKDLKDEEKAALIKVLKSHKRALAWQLSDIKGINPEFCTHKILMEDDFKPAVQHQRRVNPKIHEVIKKEVLKLLDAGLIYPISDSPWVSPVHCVPKKGGFTVVENDENELIPTRLVTGWRRGTILCFPRWFPWVTYKFPSTLKIEKNHIHVSLWNDSPNVACLYGFSQCTVTGHVPRRCKMACFNDMIEKTMEVFMDDFSVFRNSFRTCLSHLDKMLKRCEDTNLCLNREKSHFMFKEGIVLGHKISKNGIEVDKAKINVISKLPHPTTVKGIRKYGYIKNHKKTVKNGQARTRESEEYKKKPRIQSRSQKSQTRSQIQGPHFDYQCQPINETYYEPNSSYDSSGFDQPQPPQNSVDRQGILQALNKMQEKFKEIIRDQRKKIEDMSIKEMMHEQQLVDREIKEIINDLGYKRFRGEEIDEEYERDFRKKKHAYEEEKYAAACRYMLSITCDDEDDYIPLGDIIARYSTAITPDLSIKESENSLIMGDEPLSTIPATESDEVIKSSVENLVPIPSEFEGISDDTSDVPNCDNNRVNDESDFVESLVNRDTSIVYSSKIDPILEEFAGELARIAPIPPGIVEADFDPNDDTSSDDDSYEDIEYVDATPPNSELVSLEEVEDVILRDKLSNVYLLISKIEALNDNPTLSSFSNSDNSFSDHTEETRSGSTTTHANYSLPEYDSFLFEIEPDQEGLISIDNSNNTILEFSEFESFHFDLSVPRPPPESPDVEKCFEPKAEIFTKTNEKPENYVIFEVNYDGVFNLHPLRYDHGKILTLKLSKLIRMSFSKLLDMLSYKLECEIWGIFYSTPRSSLEEGLTIVEDDFDMNKMYDMGEKYGLINLYIAHFPKNLAEYYYKNLSFDAADEDVFCKIKTHEKMMQNAGLMSPEELIAWEKEEAGSPFVADELGLHDNWLYEGLSLDGPIDVGGPSMYVDETVVCDSHSLPDIQKECFANSVPLDSVGANVQVVLKKKKGRSMIKVTRKRKHQYYKKINRFLKVHGKRVSVEVGKGRLGGLVALNDHEPYDCRVTIRSKLKMILKIKEMISSSKKRLDIFKNIVFGKWLDLDDKDYDNHLLNYVLHHQRPDLSKSIDSNILFEIVGRTLLLGRAEFCLVTGFTCGKVKAGLGEAAKGTAAQPSDKGDKDSVTIKDLGELVQDKAGKGKAAGLE